MIEWEDAPYHGDPLGVVARSVVSIEREGPAWYVTIDDLTARRSWWRRFLAWARRAR